MTCLFFRDYLGVTINNADLVSSIYNNIVETKATKNFATTLC